MAERKTRTSKPRSRKRAAPEVEEAGPTISDVLHQGERLEENEKRILKELTSDSEKQDPKDPAKPVDVLEELESLYCLQMARIRIDYGTEKKINKLLMQVTSDIRVASDMLWRIAALRAGSLGLRATLKRLVHALLE